MKSYRKELWFETRQRRERKCFAPISNTDFSQRIQRLFLALAVMALPACAVTTTLSKDARRQNIYIAASVNELREMQAVHTYITKSNEPVEKLRILVANEAAENKWRDITVFVRYIDTETSSALVPATTTVPKSAVEPTKGSLPYRKSDGWEWGRNEHYNYAHSTELVYKKVTTKRYEISYWK